MPVNKIEDLDLANFIILENGKDKNAIGDLGAIKLQCVMWLINSSFKNIYGQSLIKQNFINTKYGHKLINIGKAFGALPFENIDSPKVQAMLDKNGNIKEFVIPAMTPKSLGSKQAFAWLKRQTRKLLEKPDYMLIEKEKRQTNK